MSHAGCEKRSGGRVKAGRQEVVEVVVEVVEVVVEVVVGF